MGLRAVRIQLSPHTLTYTSHKSKDEFGDCLVFVLYYLEDTEYHSAATCKILYVSDDRDKLEQVRAKLIEDSSQEMKLCKENWKQITKVHTKFFERVKQFLTRNKRHIKRNVLHITDSVWQNAHEDTKDILRNQAIANGELVKYFYENQKHELKNILELKSINEPVPILAIADIPKRLDYPEPYYYENSLLIDSAEIL